MRRKILFSLLLVWGLLPGVSMAVETPKEAPEKIAEKVIPRQKVLLVTLVNAKYEDAIQQKELVELAKQGALLKNYHGVAHPSFPNFLALVGGDTFKAKTDHFLKIDAKNIADLLEEKGKTWKVYAEDFPGNCSLKDMSKFYRQKLSPLIAFKSIHENPQRCDNIVNAKAFPDDVKNHALPDFAMYVPGQYNNGHDSDVQTSSKWVSGFLAPLLKDPEFMKETLVIVVFDQDYYYTPQNHVYAALLGPGVRAGSSSSQRLDHYSLLRTVEDYLQLGQLGKNDANAKKIDGIWSETGSIQ